MQHGMTIRAYRTEVTFWHKGIGRFDGRYWRKMMDMYKALANPAICAAEVEFTH